MPKSINLTGTAGKRYDLEEISTKNTRTSSEEELVVQVWYWNPNGINIYKDNTEIYEEHKKPNPPNLKTGQIWLSKLVSIDFEGE